jgi:hypothetical protein
MKHGGRGKGGKRRRKKGVMSSSTGSGSSVSKESSSGSGTSGESSPSSSERGYHSRQTGFEGIKRLRRSWKKRPGRVVKAYFRSMREVVGVTPGQPWVLAHAGQKLQPDFNHSYAAWRAMHGMQEALHLAIVLGKRQRGWALICLLCRALHQQALDGNSWANANLLVPTCTPGARPGFAGTVTQMEAVASFNKASKELALSTTVAGPKSRPQKPSELAGADGAPGAGAAQEEGGKKGAGKKKK